MKDASSVGSGEDGVAVRFIRVLDGLTLCITFPIMLLGVAMLYMLKMAGMFDDND